MSAAERLSGLSAVSEKNLAVLSITSNNVDVRSGLKPVMRRGERHLASREPSVRYCPTTLLVDAQGCELASLAGPAEWASEDAVKLVSAALKQ